MSEFETGEGRASLHHTERTEQQLSGLVAQGAYVDEIKEWADSQWEEEVA